MKSVLDWKRFFKEGVWPLAEDFATGRALRVQRARPEVAKQPVRAVNGALRAPLEACGFRSSQRDPVAFSEGFARRRRSAKRCRRAKFFARFSIRRKREKKCANFADFLLVFLCNVRQPRAVLAEGLTQRGA